MAALFYSNQLTGRSLPIVLKTICKCTLAIVDQGVLHITFLFHLSLFCFILLIRVYGYTGCPYDTETSY